MEWLWLLKVTLASNGTSLSLVFQVKFLPLSYVCIDNINISSQLTSNSFSVL